MIKLCRLLNKLGMGLLLSGLMVKPVLAGNGAFFGLDPDYVNKQQDYYSAESLKQQQEQAQKSNGKGKKQNGQSTTSNSTGQTDDSGGSVPLPAPVAPAPAPANGDQDIIRGY